MNWALVAVPILVTAPIAVVLVVVLTQCGKHQEGTDESTNSLGGQASMVAGAAGRGGDSGSSHAGASGHSGVSGKGGSGGQAGDSSTGSQGGQAGKAPGDAPAWTGDEALWHHVAAFAAAEPTCTLYDLRPGAEVPDEGWTWTDCGAGCEVAELVRDGRPGLGALGGVQTEEGKQKGYIKWSRYWPETTRVVTHLSPLDTGRPRLAMRIDGGCTEDNSNLESALYLVVQGKSADGKGVKVSAYPDLPGGRLWWSQPFEQGPSNNGRLTLVDGAPGYALMTGTVPSLLNYASGQFETLPGKYFTQDVGYSGDLGVFLDWETNPARVLGWSNDGLGVRSLVEGLTEDTQWVGAGTKFIVGVVGQRVGNTFNNARLWWVPRSKTLAQVPPTFSKPLPGMPAILSSNVSAAGDFLTLNWIYDNTGTAAYVYFFHTVTQQLWRYQVVSTEQPYIRVLFTTDEHFVLGRRDATDGDQQLRHLYRYRLDAIADWAEAVPFDG